MPVPFEYIPLNLGRRSERPFDFLANILSAKRSLSEGESYPLEIPRVPIVIDLVSPEKETNGCLVQSHSFEDDPSMEVVDNQSDVDSSTWTSCDDGSSSAQFASDFSEDVGLSEILEQVADMNEIYRVDEFSFHIQNVDTLPPSWPITERFNMYDCSGGDRKESIETGFPGPMDEYYEEYRRKALKVRPL